MLYNKIKNIFKKILLLPMILASVLGLMDLPGQSLRLYSVVKPNLVAVQAFATTGLYLREREDEVGYHYVSYTSSQRTVSRAGRR